MAGLDHRAVEDHRSADESHRVWRDRGRRFRCRDSLAAGLRVFREAHHARLGSNPQRARVGSPDGSPRIQTICGAGRRLGERGYRADGSAPACGIDWHSHKHACHRAGRDRRGGVCRCAGAIRSLSRREAGVRPACLFLQARPGLRTRDGEPPADALRDRRFAGRDGCLDARPRRAQYGAHVACLRWSARGAYARRHPRQRHTVLAHEHDGLFSSPVLGKQARVLCAEKRPDPGRSDRVSGRALSGAEELDRESVSQAHLLQQGRQGWPLRRVGAAGDVRGRAADGVPVTALVTEDETMTRKRAAEGGPSRRDFLVTSGAAFAAAAMPAATATAPAGTQGARSMNTITTKDGVEIFYKDWGKGQPIVFSHGWPLSADDWDTQMLFFLEHGYRVIAHDRRAHGRSTQTSDGHDMDHYADDLAALTAHLDLKNAVHVGHSTGGGEVVHYLARHGENRVAKAAIISAVPPLMVKTADNPGGLPKDVFDGFQAQLAANRSQFYRDVAAGPFYGYNRPGAKVSEAVIQNWWRQGMMGGAKAHYDGIVAFSETDFTEDLMKVTVPVLVMHGDDDQIVPYADSGPLSAKLLKNGTLKTYNGFPHGMPTTQADQINADLLSFFKGAAITASA